MPPGLRQHAIARIADEAKISRDGHHADDHGGERAEKVVDGMAFQAQELSPACMPG